MPDLIDAFPYPWSEPDAQELHAALCQLYPTPKGAMFIAARVGLDPATLFPDQAVVLLWKDILEASAAGLKSRALVQLVLDHNPTNPRRPFLESLLHSQPAAADREPRDGNSAALFLEGTDEVTEAEALLFHDDLTLAIGRIDWLIESLRRLQCIAPAVCRLTVSGSGPTQLGTGFRIGEDTILTNWHVLRRFGAPASIVAEFGYNDDGKGGGLASSAVICDPATVTADEVSDWGIVNVSEPMGSEIPTLKLSEAAVPHLGAPAFVIQHPAGHRKRLAYVRNQITLVGPNVVHYLSDTQAGSSGSPVLDEGGRLIALHHVGGTPQEVAGKPPLKKNEGIRIERVLAGLQAANIAAS